MDITSDTGRVLRPVTPETALEYVESFGPFPAVISNRDGSVSGRYTVGMKHKTGHPDTMILGVPGSFSSQIMHFLQLGLRQGTFEMPGDGELIEGVLNFPMLAKHLSNDVLMRLPLLHHEAYPGEAIDMVQLIVPDPEGRYPTDPDCRQVFSDQQNVERLLD